MALLTTVNRWSRHALWRAGLGTDGVPRAAAAVQHVLNTRGPELFEQSGVPGISAAIRFACGTHLTWTRGLVNLHSTTPMDDRTVFQACSLTKPFTAVVVMTLVDRGLLHLDQPIWKQLRSWSLPAHRAAPFDPNQVTLRRILSHSAGFNMHYCGSRSTPDPAPVLDIMRDERDPQTTLRLEAAPGSFRYSGGAYALLQLLIEDTTGLPFAQAARELVLDPLGMTSSSLTPGQDLRARLAVRHDGDGRPLPELRFFSQSASGLYTTPSDIARFWASIPHGRWPSAGPSLLSPHAAAQMLSVQSGTESGRTCGLGFLLWRKRSDVAYTHSGFATGWWGHAEGLSRRRVAYVVLSNGDRGIYAVKPLISAIRQTLYDYAL